MRIRLWLAAVVVASAAATVPGIASGSLSECKNGEMCLYGNNDWKWLISHRSASDSSLLNLKGDANNEMDSWANKSLHYDACGYGGANGTGDRQYWKTNWNDNNVAPWNSDEISSWRGATFCS
jgi:hypothetical protein